MQGFVVRAKDIHELPALQAFIDFGYAGRREGFRPESIGDVAAFVSERSEGMCAKRWLLREAFLDSDDYRCVANVLRRSETYGMVSFLLCHDGKLGAVVPKYGFSAAHFRRVFRSALGMPPKTALKAWRLARAVLEIIERRGSITEVAMDLGYASPSHLSSDFRAAMGLSLTRLLDLSDRQQGKSSEAKGNIHSVLPGDDDESASVSFTERRE